MKKWIFIAFELIGLITAGLALGRFCDAYFALQGWGVLGGAVLAYIIWTVSLISILKP